MTATHDTLDPTDVALSVARRALGEADLERRALLNVRHLIARETARSGVTPFLSELAAAVAGTAPATTEPDLDYEQLLDSYLDLVARTS